MRTRAFTLIELIVVMAVSAILLTLITIPVVYSLNLTRATQSFVTAQRSARNLVAKLEGELSEAAAVRPNHGDAGAVIGWFPDRDNNPIPVRLEYAKLDYYLPAKGDPSAKGPGGAYIDPDTGRIDPTARGPKGDVNLPAAPSTNMVRWWIGLKDPFRDYSNPYLRLLRPGAPTPTDPIRNWNSFTGAENLYVLYRAEVPTYVWDRTLGRMVPNAELFEVVDNQPVLDDPLFFVWRVGDGIAKDQRIRQWMRLGRVMTESVRFDMVKPDYNLTTKIVSFDGNSPRILPLIRFQPRRMSAEPTSAQGAVASGNESDNSAKVGSETFSAELGAWSLQNITIWPSARTVAYNFGDSSAGMIRPGLGTSLRMEMTRNPGIGLVGVNGASRTPLFSITAYQQALLQRAQANPPYPFTFAAGHAADGAGGSPSRFAPWNEVFVPVNPDTKAGSLKASFDIREVGSNSSATMTGIPYERRLPATTPNQVPANWGGFHTGPDTPYAVDVNGGGPTPLNSIAVGDFQDANVGINRRFNRLWDLVPAQAPGIANARDQFAKRFIYLAEGSQPGDPSPLDRRPAPTGSGWLRTQIVPGSEVVTGPDQRPGPNYGQSVRYTRTAQKPVGPNQYYINYVDQKEPDWTQYGLSGVSYDPADYDPTDFVSAILQVQYRAGYLEFNSRLGEPIPQGNIYVSYRFQFTEPNDIVAVDYDSSKQIEINLTVQTYPNSGIPNPQQVTVKGTASVRNFLR